MILEGLMTILQGLVGWLFLIILQMLLRIVDILERFFDIFAGTAPVYYDGEKSYLFDLFFSNKAITNIFWAMAIIAIIISFGFCIVAVARKVTDVSGTSKHTLGQIISNFIRSLIVILLLNLCITAAIKVTTVIFDRINYSLEHAESLQDEQERRYTDEEFATMVRILATMGNYAANPSAESRYNVNACFNAIRGELTTLYQAGCFNYDFPVVQTGKHTWQSALAQVAKCANLNEDLQLDTYYPTVQEAIILCFDELKTNSTFKPQETAVRGSGLTEKLTTAMMIFFASSMGSEENEQFLNGGFDDALRRSYINGEKDFLSFSDVNEDFAITEINYLVGLIVALACILFLGKVVLLFIVRMLNIMMLYVVSPLFASSMSLDEGSRFQNWTQSFVMQLLSAYASVVMMRIYLLVVPIVVNTKLEFFEPGTFANNYTIYGQLIFVLAGAWAVYKANSLISGALTGYAASAAQEADSAMGNVMNSLIGPGALVRELTRARRNKDRAKSHQKGQEKADEAKQQKKNTINTSRDRRSSRDDSGMSQSDQASLEKMRQKYGMEKVEDNSKKQSKDVASTSSSSLSKMRESMGFDNPNSPDTFNIDSLPDLGKMNKKSPTLNTTGPTTTSTPTSTSTSTSTSTPITNGGPGGTINPAVPGGNNTGINNTGTENVINTANLNRDNSRKTPVNPVPTTNTTSVTQGSRGSQGSQGIQGDTGSNGLSAPDLGRTRSSSVPRTGRAQSSADMKARLKAKTTERNTV